MSAKMKGYTGSVAMNTSLSVDTVATNKLFLIFDKRYNFILVLLASLMDESQGPFVSSAPLP